MTPHYLKDEWLCDDNGYNNKRDDTDQEEAMIFGYDWDLE